MKATVYYVTRGSNGLESVELVDEDGGHSIVNSFDIYRLDDDKTIEVGDELEITVKRIETTITVKTQ